MQNLPFPLRIYLLFKNYMRPSQNIPLPPRIHPSFSTTICDTPRIYPSLQEYTLLFNKIICGTLPESIPPSQNTPIFNKFICATLPESTPLSQNTPLFSTTIGDPPRMYPSLLSLRQLLWLRVSHHKWISCRWRRWQSRPPLPDIWACPLWSLAGTQAGILAGIAGSSGAGRALSLVRR